MGISSDHFRNFSLWWTQKKQRERKKGRKTERKTGSQTGIQTGRQTDRQTDRHRPPQTQTPEKPSSYQVEPFLPANANGEFGTSEICEEDKIPNNVVPIAVGAALAGLVVLVLVMYLIGRRQHQRGYQTV